MGNEMNLYKDLVDYEEVIEDEKIELLRFIQSKIDQGSYSIDIQFADKNEESKPPQLYTTYVNKLQMNNYVGVLMYKDGEGIKELRIGSRFDKDDKENRFLSYMLQKTLGISARTFKELSVNAGKSSKFQMLLLRRYLDLIGESSSRGYFRQYVTNKHNDSRLRGVININDHIRLNPLSNGKIAYDVTERTIDNPINILILQANDYLEHKFPTAMKDLLEKNVKLSDYIRKLKNEIPNYKQYDKKSILKKTTRPVTHPYYSVIEKLRIVSRDILMGRGLDIFGKSNVQVQGILVDVNRLWEMFLGSVLSQVETGVSLKVLKEIKSGSELMNIKPDFLIKNQAGVNQMVLDAKHKKKWQDEKIINEDVYQVVAYMNFLHCSVGGVIHPTNDQTDCMVESKVSVSKSDDGIFARIPFIIPDKKDENFDREMDGKIEEVQSKINKLLKREIE